jgi:hypothetical protein
VTIGKNAAAGVVDLDLGGGTGGVASFSIGGLPPGDVDLGDVIGDIDIGDIDARQLPSVDIGLIGIGGDEPDPGVIPPPGIVPDPGVNPGPIPDVTDRDLTDTFRNLNDEDLATLKIKCPDVLANPNAFSAAAVSICKALASL